MGRRRPKLERLESRQMLAGDSEIVFHAMDVNTDTQVTPLDALQVINDLHLGTGNPQNDVNADGDVTTRDALQIVNFLGSASTAGTLLDSVSDAAPAIASSPRVVDRVDEGLTAEIYSSADLTGVPVSIRNDPTIRFDFGGGGPDPALNLIGTSYSIRWQGEYTPEQSETHTFFAEVGSADSAIVFVDGQELFSTTTQSNGDIELQARQPVSIEVRFFAGTDASKITVGVETARSYRTALPSQSLVPFTSAQDLRGGLLAEQFDLAAGDSISDFRESTGLISNTPTNGFGIPDFHYVVPAGGIRASRLRGFVSPPTSGYYTFHLAASDDAQLWLSSGATTDTLRQIASVTSPTTLQGFEDEEAGVSDSIFLSAEQDYYIETLHVHDDELAADHLSVAWTIPETVPGMTPLGPQLIGLDALRPVVPEVIVHAEVSQTHEASHLARGTEMTFVRNDDLGRDLPVRYTVGGDAENGVDFETLSGVALIPAGQTSVTVRLDPIDDDILESPETVTTRIATDTRYQLGAESRRQVVHTIAGEIQSGTPLFDFDPLLAELLPPGFNSVAQPAFIQGIDASNLTRVPVQDDSLPFTEKTVVDVNQFSEPFETLFGYGFSPLELPNNAALFASIWVRSGNADGSDASIGMRLQESGDDFSGVETTWQVSDQWTPMLWPISTDFDGSTIDRTIDFRMGYQEQTVEVAGFNLFSFDASADLSTLPKIIHSYGGREWDSSWRDDSLDQAEEIQTRPLSISVVDPWGNPVVGAQVTIRSVEPTLPIGTAVSPERVIPTKPLSETADSKRYAALLESFDTLTDGGTAQWGPWSVDTQTPHEFLDWVVARELPYHGHALVWGDLAVAPAEFPTPSSLLTEYESLLATQDEATAQTWLKNEILQHVQTNGPGAAFNGLRPGSDQPLVNWWDVINHPLFSADIWEIFGQEFMVDVIESARATVHPDTQLVINEFDILSNPDLGLSDAFFDLLTLLDQTAVSGSAPYDVIGFQGHFVSSRLPAIDRVIEELDRYSIFGRELQIREFDVDAVSIDRQTQADYTRDFFQAISADPNMTALTIWGFWAGDHWREDALNNIEEAAALFDLDWTPRANGQWLLDQQSESKRALEYTVSDQQPLSTSVRGSLIEVTVALDGQPPQVILVDPETQSSLEVITNPLVIALDNSDGAFQVETGNWNTSSSAGGFQGSDYRLARNGDKTARFTTEFDRGGIYEVFASWSAHPNRATNAVYEIQHQYGETTVQVDQTQPSGYGYSLGLFRFESDQEASVAVKTLGTNGWVVADSIRFEEVIYEPLIDNSDSGFVVESGVWRSSSSIPGFVGDDYRFAGGGNKTARHQLPSELIGHYELFTTWTAHPSRATNATYEIVHAGGVSSVQVDQTQPSGESYSLGVFEFIGGEAGSVAVRTLDSNGSVVADSVRVVPVHGVIDIDNADAAFSIENGLWNSRSSVSGFVGADYLSARGGNKEVRFNAGPLPPGQYAVYANWTEHPTRATNARFEIDHATGTTVANVDQTRQGSVFQLLGVFTFDSAMDASVAIKTLGADGTVVADAVRFIRQ